MSQERGIGQIAIRQALFFHFRLTIREIADATGVKYHTVYGEVWRTRGGADRSYPWEIRKRKAEAIAAAEVVLQQWRRTRVQRELDVARQTVAELEAQLSALFT